MAVSASSSVPITRTARKTVYANQWITVYEDSTEESGAAGRYSVVSRPDAAVVVVTSPSGSVLMLNSFRYPTGRYSLELPMGAVDSGESPEAAARRELREETGVVRDRLDFLGWFFALPGLSDQRVHVFGSIASDDELRSARTPDSEAALAGVVLVRVEQVPWLAAAGKVTDSLTLCGLALAGIGVRAQHGAGG